MRAIKIFLLYLICWLTSIFLWFVLISDLGQNPETILLTDKKFLSFLSYAAFFCLPVLPIAAIYTSGLQIKYKIMSMWLLVAALIILLIALILFFAMAEKESEGWIALILTILGGFGTASMVVVTTFLSFTSRLNPGNLLRRLLIWLVTMLVLDLLYITRIVRASFHWLN